ncbi:hypothetical protein [Aliirhizobium smilacinae]|jgi:hypothetical protein|uniref:Uncharacterized protein n=1 Tax=Aliirhizobium smilacinae TaxID=1395944 RepID=A0A5C4XRB4_9HYPH|nr:hypothetical protein [Rhizobium smilacinae]TNM65837.1 hypothetical protein FHP24_06275 [Rhizobium smilacinae]
MVMLHQIARESREQLCRAFVAKMRGASRKIEVEKRVVRSRGGGLRRFEIPFLQHLSYTVMIVSPGACAAK